MNKFNQHPINIGKNELGNTEYFKEINRRAALCKGTRRSNCIGTALYLVGEKEKDEFESIWNVPELTHLKISKTPILGCLIAWQTYSRTRHLGVVTSITPLLITHREGNSDLFFENEYFEVADRPYGCCWYEISPEIKYYLPRGLKVAENQVAAIQTVTAAAKTAMRE